jgi:hypothetical protein
MKRVIENLGTESPVWNGIEWRGYLDSVHMLLKRWKELYLKVAIA